MQIRYFADYAKIRIVSQLISAISKILQELLKYFNSAIIFMFIVSALPALFAKLELNLNYSEPGILPFGSSLEYCHKTTCFCKLSL